MDSSTDNFNHKDFLNNENISYGLTINTENVLEYKFNILEFSLMLVSYLNINLPGTAVKLNMLARLVGGYELDKAPALSNVLFVF